MADPIKHILGKDAVRWMAESLLAAYPVFDDTAFETDCLNGLEALELLQRARHIADAMARHLPSDFPAAAAILRASLGPEADPEGGTGIGPLLYFPHDFFIQTYGINHPEAAFETQHALTKRSSCEFSIRAFIEKYPDLAYRQLTEWARDDNAHVRRLASEGSRPRLPWAPRLRQYQRDPAPVLALLDILKDDPSRYVQRSVANNLNDIGKEHPDIALETARRWLEGAGAGRLWIVRHALRSLVKKGARDALALMGAGAEPKVRISGARLMPETVTIGAKLRFIFDIVSEAEESQHLLIDYAVFFIKANGASSPKVFKLTQLTLEAGARAQVSGSVSLAVLTTRKPYPGTHRIEARINGTDYAVGAFEVEE